MSKTITLTDEEIEDIRIAIMRSVVDINELESKYEVHERILAQKARLQALTKRFSE